jgi:dihydroxyacetone kinase-like predicted kinase
MDSDDVRVVIEKIHPSRRIYHISGSFSCELDNMLAKQPMLEMVKAQLPQEALAAIPEESHDDAVEQLVDIMMSRMHNCEIGELLEEIKHCVIEHTIDQLDVSIQLAKTSWPVVHRQIITILGKYFDEESIEVEEVMDK